MFELQVRPIDAWPGGLTNQRRASPFARAYRPTMQLLERELRMVRAKAPVLLMALNPDQIRLDGRPRSDAQPAHPGVILCFDSKHGPQRYPCDAFTHWQDNLRAIALALEALRKVDRYGVSRRGEQYKGWQALPPPQTASPPIRALREFIESLLDGRLDWSRREEVERALTLAERKTHPDAGGTSDDFKRVQEARRLLLP